ncbi:MAG: type I methionyl aminopeptidase [Eggerthellaceae bacterium]|nr:type I methionyl aminopeptidase [Eggerthellaceae bacterium]
MAVILKTPEEIEAMKEAGRLSAEVLREVGARCVPGVSTLELDQFAEDYIRSRGGIPTFKGYGGFPGSICASINEQIVHGIPSSTVKLKSGDIISIDVGATVDGWAGDNAWTFAVGRIGHQVKKLLEITEKSMWMAIAAARPGNRLGDIGHAVQAVAKSGGFGVVRDYTGHGIGRDMHESPQVPNYGLKHTGMKLQVGMVLAIEPMLTMGTHKTHVMRDGWLVVTQDGKPAAHFEKTVAITEDGPVLVSTEPGRDRPL